MPKHPGAACYITLLLFLVFFRLFPVFFSLVSGIRGQDQDYARAQAPQCRLFALHCSRCNCKLSSSARYCCSWFFDT